jgi:hypothetical protein
VVDAGGAQGIVGLFLDQPALAGHEGCGHRARLPADHARDPLRRLVPGAVDQSGGA